MVSILLDPFHAVFYIMFVTSLTTVFSKVWVEIAGLTAKDVARDLKENQMVIKGRLSGGLCDTICSCISYTTLS